MKQKNLLHSEFSGSGPTVVLLPGMFGSSRYFSELIPALHKAGKSTLTIDLLGFGRSPKPRNSDYDFDAHCSAILNTIDAHRITQPVTIIGVSMASTLIVDLLRRRTAFFNKAVYISPMICSSPKIAEELSYLTGNIGPLLRTKPVSWVLCHTVCAVKPVARVTYRMVDTNNQPRPIVDDATLHTWRSYSRSFTNILVGQNIAKDLLSTNIESVIIYGKNDKSMEHELLEMAAKNPKVMIYASPVSHHPVLDDMKKTVEYIV